MPTMKKTKIAMFPSFKFEALIATFLDKDKFEIIPVDITKKDINSKYLQGVYGEWCYPLKLTLGMYERVIKEEGVEKVIDIALDVCRYPLVMGDPHRWIKEKFEYYPIALNGLSISLSYVKSMYTQLKKAIPGFNLNTFSKKIKLVKNRMDLAGNMNDLFDKNLSLVKNPKLYKARFKELKQKFINADSLEESESIAREFETYTKQEKIYQKPEFRFLLSGDAAVISMEFSLFDLEVFLAKNRIEMINPGYGPSLYHAKYSKNAKKAKQIISKIFSTKHQETKVKGLHWIETITLYQILNGISKGVDGIIYIKPNMCAPCENLSYILKKENYFGIPFVEISYDEHTGVNNIITRLEAFINVVRESK